MSTKRSVGITAVAVLMIIFGIAEIATGLTHSFLGILSTSNATLSTYGAVAVGSIYAIGGLLLLTMRKREAKLALVCLLFVIIGRASLVAMGLYPLNSLLQNASIIIGTGLAVIFLIYIKLNLNKFN